MPRIEIPMGNMNDVPDNTGSPEDQVAAIEGGVKQSIKREHFIKKVLDNNARAREAEAAEMPKPTSPEKPKTE